MNYIIKVILLLVVLSMISCSSSRRFSNYYEPNHRKSALYTRDSLYIHYTMHTFIEESYTEYKGMHSSDSCRRKHTIYIDTIFYSPDSLKLLSIILFKGPYTIYDINCDPPRYMYSATALVGIREDKSQPWKIYPWTPKSCVGYSRYVDVQFIMRDYYFRVFKDRSIFLARDGQWILEKFIYNVNDAGFWTGILWQKDLKIPGYYTFQVEYGTYPLNEPEGYKRAIVPYLPIKYPDYLLQQYKSN